MQTGATSTRTPAPSSTTSFLLLAGDSRHGQSTSRSLPSTEGSASHRRRAAGRQRLRRGGHLSRFRCMAAEPDPSSRSKPRYAIRRGLPAQGQGRGLSASRSQPLNHSGARLLRATRQIPPRKIVGAPPRSDKGSHATPSALDTCASTNAGVAPAFVSDVLVARSGTAGSVADT
jgi:hypothetical protein